MSHCRVTPPSCWWLWVDDHGRLGAGIPPDSFLQCALGTVGLYLLPFFFLTFPPSATVSAEEKGGRVKMPVRHASVFTCKELPLNFSLFPLTHFLQVTLQYPAHSGWKELGQ